MSPISAGWWVLLISVLQEGWMSESHLACANQEVYREGDPGNHKTTGQPTLSEQNLVYMIYIA